MADRFIQGFLLMGLCVVWLPISVMAQDTNPPPLEHAHYYVVGGVFQEEVNAHKLNSRAKDAFPSAFVARHPETGMFYLIFEKSRVPFPNGTLERYKKKGFEGTWLYRFLLASPLYDKAVNQEERSVSAAKSEKIVPTETMKSVHSDSLILIDKRYEEMQVSADTAFQRVQNLADTTIRALDLLMRTASGSKVEEVPPIKQQEGEILADPEKLVREESAPKEQTGFKTFDAELPRLENHLYTNAKEPYEEEFTLMLQTRGFKSNQAMDLELLDGHQQVRFMRLAPNQVHQVRVPKDAMRDLVLRGVLGDGYTFSLGLDLMVIFYSKTLNSKIIQVSDRNLVVFPPSNFQDDSSPRYVFYFQNGSSVLERSCLYELNELVRFLKEHPEQGLRITGYTNAGGMGKAWKNIHDEFFKISDLTIKQDAPATELAMDRAMSVQRYLIKQGIDPLRIEVNANTSRKLFGSNLFEGRYNARAEVFLEKF
jgi:outer membrane protein OmpA-like peptidoglycan-associated protein